jgi:hypothetical protein
VSKKTKKVAAIGRVLHSKLIWNSGDTLRIVALAVEREKFKVASITEIEVSEPVSARVCMMADC